MLIVGAQNVYFTDIHVYVNGQAWDGLGGVVPSGATVVVEGKLINTQTPSRTLIVKYMWSGETRKITVGADGRFRFSFKAPNWADYGWCGQEKYIVMVNLDDPVYSWVRFAVKAKCECVAPKLSVEITDVTSALAIMSSALYIAVS